MKDIATSEVKHALRLVFERKLVLLACTIADIIFFILYGFATAPIYQKLVQYMNIIGSLASDAINVAAREQKSLSSIVLEPPVRPYFNDLLLLLLLLGITTYMLYCLIHAFIWNKALGITGKKQGYLQYLRHFMKVNLVWFLFFVVYYFAGFAVNLREIAVRVLTKTNTSSFQEILLYVLLFVVAYFAIISYTGLNVRKSLSIGIRKIKMILPAFLIVIVVMLVLHLLLTVFAKVHFYAMFVFGLLFIMPFFTIARVYISLVIQKIK